MSTTKEVDFYAILGVPEKATQEEIKRNYNELVLVHHPDKGGDPQKFKQLQLAYKILSNPKTRQLYTQSLSSTYQDLTSEYRRGSSVGLQYDRTADDFTVGQTDEEKEQKKTQFMQKFAAARHPDDQCLIEQMEQTGDQGKVSQEQFNSYQKTRDTQEFDVPIVTDLMTEKFDPNLFNQLFEQHKQQHLDVQIPSTELEPYHPINSRMRTDLASVETHGIFGTGCNEVIGEKEMHDNLMFQTHSCETLSQLDSKKCDLTRDITKTAGSLLPQEFEHQLEERLKLQQTIKFKHQPDDNPLSLAHLEKLTQ
uniref:J domain-containing protein n=1 Tax=viral metagenome TaxID=1070528 RepID=A0A6C0BLE4_9ZZZZ